MPTVFLFAFSISMTTLIFHWDTAQAQNDTRRIFNLTDNTITTINKTTNETISTVPYPMKTGNTVTNETISNMTSPGNQGNMTSPGNQGNTSIDLTEKFKALGNK
jgi:hypothetical protein